MSSLGLMAVVRNEGHILDEFINHYLWQGIDHFYFIDNNSTDNSYEIYDKYKSIITLLQEPRVVNVSTLEEGDIQVSSYGKMLKNVETDWLYICDMDEFAYARRGFKTIKSFIETHENTFDQFLIRLKTFNSNGHINQPKFVVESFTKRHIHRYNKNQFTLPNKCIVKTNKIRRINITHCQLTQPSVTVDSTLTHFIRDCDISFDDAIKHTRNVTEETYENSYIVSNHYTVQSKNFYFNNKALRGRASKPALIKGDSQKFYESEWIRTEKHSCVDDFELFELTKNK